MVLGVVSHLVTGAGLVGYKVRIGPRLAPDHEERRHGVHAPQDGEHLRGIGTGPVVEGEGDVPPSVTGELHVCGVGENSIDRCRLLERRVLRGCAGRVMLPARRVVRRLDGGVPWASPTAGEIGRHGDHRGKERRHHGQRREAPAADPSPLHEVSLRRRCAPRPPPRSVRRSSRRCSQPPRAAASARHGSRSGRAGRSAGSAR